MIKILFVCYGNICRSPMAEFLMKDLVEKQGEGKDFYIASSATSKEEAGLRVHRGTRAILDEMGISYEGKVSIPLEKTDYDKYDYIIGMDANNKRDMLRIFGGDPKDKVSLLLDYTDNPRDVLDPWWTGDFEATKRDVIKGTKALYDHLKNNF